MKKKLTNLLILLVMLASTSVLQGQDDTIRTLIFTEVYGPTKYHTYVELTNVGDAAVNLSNFELGTTRYSIQFPGTFDNRNTMLPDFNLQPDSSYIIANVNDWQDNYGWKLDSWASIMKYGKEVTGPALLTQIDTAIYFDEDLEGRQGGMDSISTDNLLIHINDGIGLYLEHHVGEDSVIVDGVRVALDADNYPDRDDKFAAVAGIPLAYPNYILVRKSNVTQGNTDWDDSRGNTIADSEWLPIPDRSTGVYNNTTRFFTTIRHHGNATLDNTTVSSNSIDIDWTNMTMSVPWGTYRDSIMDEFSLAGGIAWHLTRTPSVEDSTSRIVVMGDMLSLYAVSEVLTQIDFTLMVKDPADDMNLVFPINRRTYDEVDEVFEWDTPFYVTQNIPGSDTIGDIDFAMRVDSLFKYLVKAPDADWEIVWVDGKERVDLKQGDLLKVTAKDASVKNYFIDAFEVPEPSHNAFLSAITWPDVPSFLRQSPQWKDDTIPGFSPGVMAYELQVPYGTTNVPALVAIPENLNAQISVTRATAVSGPVMNRTTTFSVAAEDDTSQLVVYSVIFKVERPDELVQPFKAEPLFTDILHMRTWNERAIEITNPGNTPIDLSNYMIVIGAASNPADIITSDATDFDDKYKRYVPGYQYQPLETWGTSPNTLIKDYDVNPIIEPGGSFVIARVRSGSYAGYDAAINYDVVITLDSYGVTIDEAATNTKVYWSTGSKNYVSFWRFGSGQLCLFKITNPEVKAGTKAVTDPDDYELVDMLGNWTGDAWTPDGATMKDEHRMVRKPEFWEGDTLPGVLGSFGATPEESEWIVTPLSWDLTYEAVTSGAIGTHSFSPIFNYSSTISSSVYRVSDGFETPQNIYGVPTGTTVDGFMVNIDKAHVDQGLKVMGKESATALVDGDTLMVTSADSSSVTKYAINLGLLSSDAVLIAKSGSGLTVAYDGATGSISGIEFGSTISEVLGKLDKPQKALINIIDNNNNLVPAQIRNFANVYVQTKASNKIVIEVIAEDGQAKISYDFIMNNSVSDAYLFSDLYNVDQTLQLVSGLPQGTSVKTLLKYLLSNEGATIKIENKSGEERVMGTVVSDDKIIVTSEDQSFSKVYFIKFLNALAGAEAYVVSDVLVVDQLNMMISGITANTLSDVLIGLVTPADGATIEILDMNDQVVVNSPVGEGYTLVVTSGDGTKKAVYSLSFVVSVNNRALDQIRIYPNPATDNLFIEASIAINSVVIKNVSGVTVKIIDGKNIQNGSISIGDLPSGLYLIYANSGVNLINPIKLIKQ